MFKKKKRKKINVLLLIITNDNDYDWIKSYSSSQEQHFVFLDNYYLIKLIYKLYKAELIANIVFRSWKLFLNNLPIIIQLIYYIVFLSFRADLWPVRTEVGQKVWTWSCNQCPWFCESKSECKLDYNLTIPDSFYTVGLLIPNFNLCL